MYKAEVTGGLLRYIKWKRMERRMETKKEEHGMDDCVKGIKMEKNRKMD